MSAFDFRTRLGWQGGRGIERRLSGPPLHIVVGDDDRSPIAAIFTEIRLSPGTHLLVGMAGLAFGTVGTAGLAWVWSWFL